MKKQQRKKELYTDRRKSKNEKNNRHKKEGIFNKTDIECRYVHGNKNGVNRKIKPIKYFLIKRNAEVRH